MTRITIDAATVARLHGLSDAVELCDEAGVTLGYFHPSLSPPRDSGGRIVSPITAEELKRRSIQRTGRPLKDILEDIEKK